MSRLFPLEEVRGPMLLYGVCILLLNWVFGSALAGFINDLWDKPILQSALFYIVSMIAISGTVCLLFAIISSVILWLTPKKGASNLLISIISLTASISIMIGLNIYAEQQFQAHRKQKIALEKQAAAELASIAKARPLSERCWGKDRKVREFHLGSIFTRSFKGGVALPSQANTILLVVARQGSPVYYQGSTVAYGFAMHFCFISQKEDRVLQYTLQREPPGTISVRGYGNVRFEGHVRREANKFFKHVVVGHPPGSFKPKTNGVIFEIGSSYECRIVGDTGKRRKVCSD